MLLENLRKSNLIERTNGREQVVVSVRVDCQPDWAVRQSRGSSADQLRA